MYETWRRLGKKHKEWYDQRAWELYLQGDQVMVLLPTSTEKLLAKWRGPYKITIEIVKVNYKIEITNGWIRRKTIHINMLKSWKETAESFLTQEQQQLHEAQYGTDLTTEQRNYLQMMLQEFLELITMKPRKMTKVKHRILTNDQQSICQQPYRIPLVFREEITNELKELLNTGIVEESNSEWNS